MNLMLTDNENLLFADSPTYNNWITTPDYNCQESTQSNYDDELVSSSEEEDQLDPVEKEIKRMLKIENLIAELEDDFIIVQQEANEHFKKECIKLIKRNSSHHNMD
jgi:hypothetical protein